ncbi:glycosyl hydrolase family 18 protein [Algicola sagamiensis]|uniref:glycosyl hydrolase family 18 protein n=1 Tax=Algicola sagamiensis TaxID=163869 RepID=UPI000368870B|nr:glycosyl hydrolase family 18 protein [Algicola sagamiensis]
MNIRTLIICTTLGVSYLNAAPATPSIDWVADQTMQNGEVTFPISWKTWGGDKGDIWQLYQNDILIHEENLANLQAGQSGEVPVTVKRMGNYEYKVKICAGSDCATSAEKVVKVKPSAPGDIDPWEDLDTSLWPHPLKAKNKAYQNTSGKQVGAYYTEWSIYDRKFLVEDIPAKNLTHLYYGFIAICGPNESYKDFNPSGWRALQQECQGKEDFDVVFIDRWATLDKPFDPQDTYDFPLKGIFGQLYRLKKTHPNVRILPSVGGWSLSDPFYFMTKNEQNRKKFVESMVRFIQEWDFFEGIDIDWEFPGGGGLNSELGSPEDGETFVLLMKELRAALDSLAQSTGKTYELTAAMSGGVEKLSRIPWKQAAPYMDYINLMTYDYYGGWDNTLGHFTGIYPTDWAPIEGFSADEAVQYMLSEQIPSEKITLGAAMYGRGWGKVSGVQNGFPFSGQGGGPVNGTYEKGIDGYKHLIQKYLGENGQGVNGFEVSYDETAEAAYAWHPQKKTLISYDNPRSVLAKGHYIQQHQLGGIFAWELNSDNGEILNAMHRGLGHRSGNDQNRAPIANAGRDQSVRAGNVVQLSGAASTDPDGDLLSYQWQQVSGPQINIAKADRSDTSFVAPDVENQTTIVLSLQVSDGILTHQDRIQVTILPASGDQPPVVTIEGDHIVQAGQSGQVQLQASDPEQKPLSYQWQLPSGWVYEGQGSSAVTYQAPNLDSDQSFIISVVVSDGTHDVGLQHQVQILSTDNDQCSRAEAWDANQVYVKGDRVVYGNSSWQAKWWTRGEKPGKSLVWQNCI